MESVTNVSAAPKAAATPVGGSPCGAGESAPKGLFASLLAMLAGVTLGANAQGAESAAPEGLEETPAAGPQAVQLSADEAFGLDTEAAPSQVTLDEAGTLFAETAVLAMLTPAAAAAGADAAASPDGSVGAAEAPETIAMPRASVAGEDAGPQESIVAASAPNASSDTVRVVSATGPPPPAPTEAEGASAVSPSGAPDGTVTRGVVSEPQGGPGAEPAGAEPLLTSAAQAERTGTGYDSQRHTGHDAAPPARDGSGQEEALPESSHRTSPAVAGLRNAPVRMPVREAVQAAASDAGQAQDSLRVATRRYDAQAPRDGNLPASKAAGLSEANQAPDVAFIGTDTRAAPPHVPPDTASCSLAEAQVISAAERLRGAPNVQAEVRTLERPTLDAFPDFAVRSVRYLVNRGERSIQVRLVPESLGEVRLEVSQSESGLTVRLASASPVVRDALESQAGALREVLARDGTAVNRVVVTANLASGHSASGQPGRHAAYTPQDVRISQFSGSYRGPAEPAARTWRTSTAHAGVLDILV